MPASPITLILNYFNYLLLLVIVSTDIWLLRHWWITGRQDDRLVIAAVILTIFLFCGRFIVFILSPIISKRKSVSDIPNHQNTEEKMVLDRPDGSQIYMQLAGSPTAPVMILLHGLGTDGNNWFYQKHYLSHKYRLVLPDLPGFGQSKKSDNNDYSLNKYADDIASILTHFKDQPVLVAGHSMGGMILLRYLGLYKDTILQNLRAIALLDTTYTDPLQTAFGSSLWIRLEWLIRPLITINSALSPLMRLMNWLSYINGSMHLSVLITGFTTHQSWSDLDFAAQYSYRTSYFSTAQAALAILENEALVTAQNLDLPTLILTGSSDLVTRPHASTTLNDTIKNSQLITIDNAAHMSIIEQGEEISKELDRFYSSILQST